MGNMGWLLLDAALVIAGIAIIVRYVNKGFMRALVDMIGLVLAAAVGAIVAGLLADVLFDAFVRPPLADGINQLMRSPVRGDIGQLLRFVPQILLNLLAVKHGDNYMGLLNQAFKDPRGDPAEVVINDIVGSAVKPVIAMLLFLVLFALLMLAVKLVSRAFQSVNELPVVGGVNMALGGLLGLVAAFITLFIIVQAAQLLITVNGGEGMLLTKDVVRRTFVYRFLTVVNPLELLLGLFA